jgi:CRISPR/Cas system CSM-associated protein Csm2 small subunit
MEDDLQSFSGEQLLWLSIMSNKSTRVLIEHELGRRAKVRKSMETLARVLDHAMSKATPQTAARRTA